MSKELEDLKNMDVGNDIMEIMDNDECTYLEAILTYCENKDLDVESMSKIIPSNIINLLEKECLDKNLIKGKKKTQLL